MLPAGAGMSRQCGLPELPAAVRRRDASVGGDLGAPPGRGRKRGRVNIWEVWPCTTAVASALAGSGADRFGYFLELVEALRGGRVGVVGGVDLEAVDVGALDPATP